MTFGNINISGNTGLGCSWSHKSCVLGNIMYDYGGTSDCLCSGKGRRDLGMKRSRLCFELPDMGRMHVGHASVYCS